MQRANKIKRGLTLNGTIVPKNPTQVKGPCTVKVKLRDEKKLVSPLCDEKLRARKREDDASVHLSKIRLHLAEMNNTTTVMLVSLLGKRKKTQNIQ